MGIIQGHLRIPQSLHHGSFYCGHRDPGPATTTGDLQTINQAAEATAPRPHILGHAFLPLAGLAIRLGHCSGEKPSSDGTARASNCTGNGNRGPAANPDAHPSDVKSGP